MNYKKMRVFYLYFSKNSVRIFLAFITKILQTYQQLWITMWKVRIPSKICVDNSVDNSESFPHFPYANVEK